MELKKVRSGLFVDFDTVRVLEYVGVKDYNEQEKKLIRGLTIKATLADGVQVPALFFAEMQDETEESVKRAEKECDEFVSKFFLKK